MSFPLDITESLAAMAKMETARKNARKATSKATRIVYNIDEIIKQGREAEAVFDLMKAFTRAIAITKASAGIVEAHYYTSMGATAALMDLGFGWNEAYAAVKAVAAAPDKPHEFESKSGKRAAVVIEGARLFLSPVKGQPDLFDGYTGGGFSS